jgi:hypothetical protein
MRILHFHDFGVQNVRHPHIHLTDDEMETQKDQPIITDLLSGRVWLIAFFKAGCNNLSVPRTLQCDFDTFPTERGEPMFLTLSGRYQYFCSC